jgi:hypothetical protein
MVGERSAPEPLPIGGPQREAAYEDRKFNSEFCHIVGGETDRVFEKLQREQLVCLRLEAMALDSTTVKVHPDGTGALKKTDRKRLGNRVADGPPRFIWWPQMLERP